MRADVHLVLPNGFTPLCIAVLNQRPELPGLQMKRGFKRVLKQGPIRVTITGYYGGGGGGCKKGA